MKSLYLITAFFKTHFKNNKFLFTLFLLGIFVSSLILTYYYGNVSPNNNLIYDEMKSVFQTYTIELSVTNGDILEQGVSWLEQQGFTRIDYFGYCDLKSDSSEFLNADSIEVRYCKDDTYNFNSALGRVSFTEEEKSGENVIILSQEYLDFYLEERENLLNQTVLLNGVEFTLIGFYNLGGGAVIPYQSFVKNQFEVNRIQVVVNEILNYQDDVNLKAEISNNIPGARVVSAYDTYYNYLEQGDSYDYLRSITIYMLLGFIVFMFLVKYIIDSSRYEYVVYSIVGASRKKVVGIMIAEILGITLLTSIVAMLFHHLFYEVIFDKINYFSGLQYHVEDYGIILLIVLVVSVICVVPFMISYLFNDLISSKNSIKK